MTSITGDYLHPTGAPRIVDRTLGKFLLVSLAAHLAFGVWVALINQQQPEPAMLYVNLTDAAAPTQPATPAVQTVPAAPATPAAPVEPPPEPESVQAAPEPEAQPPAKTPEPAPQEPAPEQPATEAAPATDAASADASSAASTGNAPNMDAIQRKAFDEILPQFEDHWLYPSRAKQQRLEGNVQIIVTVLPDGTVTDPRVPITSGFNILDLNTIFIMQKVRKINPLPAGVGPIDVILNVPYRLDQGQ